MEMSPNSQRELAEMGRRGHVAELLGRYPDVDSGEAAEILDYLKKGPPLEVALIGTDDRLKARLLEFRADHRSEFSLGPKHYLAVAAIVVGLVAILAALWDSGIGR